MWDTFKIEISYELHFRNLLTYQTFIKSFFIGDFQKTFEVTFMAVEKPDGLLTSRFHVIEFSFIPGAAHLFYPLAVVIEPNKFRQSRTIYHCVDLIKAY